jgi:hypothetical protein
MSHFAKVYLDGVVETVIFAEQDFIDSLPIEEGYTWVQTSYNTKGNLHYSPITGLPDDGIPLRKNYAQIGGIYDINKDAFIPPQPFNSWLLDDETCLWYPPTPKPNEPGKYYYWGEMKQEWIEFTP